MRLDLLALLAGLILTLAFDGALSAARAALMNSHAPVLRSMETKGVRGASRALGLASEATSLLLSFSLVQYLARLTAVAVALAGWVLWAGPSASPGGGVGVVLAVGALAPLVEVLAESVSLRSAERAACRLSLVGTAVVLVAAPVRWSHRRLARASDGRRAGVVPP
ncbi:MAG TPA: CNNM domain-containing protein, partial [Anaerolineales bacterium]|nr:CNNM domain-containing protein [Anaerolineales bacterium]